MLATDISGGLYDWVRGVASTGTFVKNPEATWDVIGTSGVPSGWTVKFDGEDSGGIDFGELPPESTEFVFPLYINITEFIYDYGDELEYFREQDEILDFLEEYFWNNCENHDYSYELELTNDCQIYINGSPISTLYKPLGGTEIIFNPAPSPFREVMIEEGGLWGYIDK